MTVEFLTQVYVNECVGFQPFIMQWCSKSNRNSASLYKKIYFKMETQIQSQTAMKMKHFWMSDTFCFMKKMNQLVETFNAEVFIPTKTSEKLDSYNLTDTTVTNKLIFLRKYRLGTLEIHTTSSIQYFNDLQMNQFLMLLLQIGWRYT